MKTILFILQKEFLQIFRNKTMLPLIFVLPVVQLLILVNAATFEIKSIHLSVVNDDHSPASRELISRFDGSPFFRVVSYDSSVKVAEQQIMGNHADMILNIPAGFEQQIVTTHAADLQLLINAIDGMAAGVYQVYAGNIISDFQQDYFTGLFDGQTPQLPVQVTHRFWFNPNLNYSIYMLPGILMILVTIIAMFLTAINIVREKESGTIEQINVTPIKKYQFILGKMIPFLIIALFELSFGLLIGRIFFSLPMEGSLGLLYLFAFIYLLIALGLGLFLSAISSTQQQVMFTVFFFLLMFILMSGLFTPIDSMPQWAKMINVINPFQYFMTVLRMVLLKGSGLADLMHEFVAMSIYAAVAMSLAVWRYRKTAG